MGCRGQCSDVLWCRIGRGRTGNAYGFRAGWFDANPNRCGMSKPQPDPPRLTGSKPHDEERVKVLWGALQAAREVPRGPGEPGGCLRRLEDAIGWKRPSAAEWRSLRADIEMMASYWRGVDRVYAKVRAAIEPSDRVVAKLAAIDRLDPILIAEREEKYQDDLAACKANRLAELKERLADTQSEIERLEGEVADGD